MNGTRSASIGVVLGLRLSSLSSRKLAVKLVYLQPDPCGRGPRRKGHRRGAIRSVSLGENTRMLGTILLVILILLLLGALPAWPHSREWGYFPSGGLGLIVVIIIILLLMGRI